MKVYQRILTVAASVVAASSAIADDGWCDAPLDVELISKNGGNTTRSDQGAADGGYGALVARLGAATPTGAGIGMNQVEASADVSGDNFAPDLTSSEFTGKSIVVVNNGNPYTVSWHSTTVASWLYGANTSMAKGAPNAWVFNLNVWLSSFLKVNQASQNPSPPNSLVRVYNDSWIGSYGSGNDALDRQAIRRFDFLMYRDGVLAVSGENNGTGSARYPMMGDTFNGLSVGRLDLQHSAGVSGALSDTPGRMKPEIIAPGQYTSFSTPVVGSAAALLFQQSQTSGSSSFGLAAMPRAQLVKAALLGGALRDSNWSDQAPQSGAQRGIATKPLDPLRGAGSLDIDKSNQILAGDRYDGASSAQAATRSGPVGYGSFTMTGSQKLYWRFRVTQLTPQLDFVVTWPRVVSSFTAAQNQGYTLANLDLHVTRGIQDAAVLQSLEGDGGAACFGGGNVSSVSPENNIEIVHMTSLVQGEYVVEVSRVDVSSTPIQVSVAWQIDPIGFGIEGDLDGSGSVDSGDIGQVLLNFGTDDPSSDVDLSGSVDGGDLGWILLNFS